jgi:cell division protease FtsH
LGNLVFGSESEIFLGKDYGHVQNYSEKLAGIIDEEVKRIIDEAYDEVLSILRSKMGLLNRLAETLLEKEKIEGPEFESIYTRAEAEADMPAADSTQTKSLPIESDDPSSETSSDMPEQKVDPD